MRKIFLIGICVLSMTACEYVRFRHQIGVVAEVGANVLYQTDLDKITIGTHGADSARLAEAYIKQWAIGILEYDAAKDKASERLENLVDDYRRSLYIHNYEQNLIDHRMSKKIPDTLIANFYESNKSRFVLRESIVRGLLVVVPQKTPKQDMLKQWLQKPYDENIERIEKYAYQYSSGYELFTEEWKTVNQILLRMPIEPNEFNQLLQSQNQIVLEDTMAVYFLQVTDKRFLGEQMPIEYAESEIKDILLSQRQVDFLLDERNRLYNEAILFKKIRIYEKE